MSQKRLPKVFLALVFCSSLAFAAKSRARVAGVVNINQASEAQLRQLGLSSKVAQEIVTQREKQKFARVDDVAQIKGLGRKRFAKLRPHLAVSGATTFQKVSGKRSRKEGSGTPPAG